MAEQDTQSPFVWGRAGAKMTPEQVARDRAIAEALLKSGVDTSPVGHWTQGAARLANAIAGSFRSGMADDAEAAGRAEYQKQFDEIVGSLMGGTDVASAAPGAGVAPVASVGTAPAYATEYGPVPPARIGETTADPNAPVDMSWLKYGNEGATRSLPLSQDLTKALSFLPELGVQMEVFSGGQPTASEGGGRVGSPRHDHGGAGDVFFYKDGRRLDWANTDDIPIYQAIVRRAKQAGVTGFGAGEGYMRPGSMHIGFGAPGVWGAGGRGANAPDWLRTAYEGGGAPVMASSAPSASAAIARMASATPPVKPSMGYADQQPVVVASVDPTYDVAMSLAQPQAKPQIPQAMRNAVPQEKPYDLILDTMVTPGMLDARPQTKPVMVDGVPIDPAMLQATPRDRPLDLILDPMVTPGMLDARPQAKPMIDSGMRSAVPPQKPVIDDAMRNAVPMQKPASYTNVNAPYQDPQAQQMGYANGGERPIVGTLDANGRPMLSNPDGSVSTELSITVTDPRLNGGAPTNIPSIWGGRELDEDGAVAAALQSGQRFQSFNSIPEAVAAAESRSASLGDAVDKQTGGSPVSAAMLAARPQAKPNMSDVVKGVATSLAGVPAQASSAQPAAQGASLAAAPQARQQPSMAQLVKLASDPWASEGSRAVISSLIKQQMQQQDPMRALQMEKARLEIEQAKKPKPIEVGGVLVDPNTYQPVYDSRVAKNNVPESVRALEERARLANIQPGTPEYAEFFRTGGSAPKGQFRLLTQDEVKSQGLPPGAYQVDTNGKVSQVGGGGVNVNLGSPPSKSVFDTMSARSDDARAAAQSLPAFANARAAIDSGKVVLGAGADMRLGMQKIGALLGMDPSAAENTETFRAAIAPVVLSAVRGLGAGTGISNADRDFAEKAAGGNITLEPGAIRRLLDIGQRAAEAKIKAFNETLDRVYPESDPDSAKIRALFGIQVPKAASPSVDDLLKKYGVQ